MDREEAKEILPIIQTFAEGKTIQDWTNNTWKDKEYTSFGELSQSPIKPQPKYRPFKTQEECWNEMHKHQPFGWVEVRTTRLYTLIIAVDKTNVVIPNSIVKFDMAFEDFKFKDGTPFGIKKE